MTTRRADPAETGARGCLDDNEVVEHCRGVDSAAARAAVVVHLDRCAACRELVSEFVRAFSGDAQTPAESATLRATTGPAEVTPAALAPLSRIGRYLVLHHVGTGGMGVVHAGYDPELDRKVALKLLARGEPATDGQARLMQEAQALARVAHPHVVTVHDVGVHDDRVWLAMEFIDGVTLSTWLRARARGWRELLAVFLAAGEGLAAVHAAGLVHRDFKPDNVMIDAEGRARVMDLGLSRVESPGPKDSDLAALSEAVGRARTTALTRTGSLLGTPRYMAPEQWLGEAVDARSDVFAFCVALWEALYDEHPFAGETAADLAAAVCSGQIRAPRAGAGVPTWLRRVVERGLDREPARRPAGMQALLAALQADPTRRTRRRAALVGLGLALAGAALGWQLDRGRRAAACSADAAGIAAVWTPAVRDELGRAARTTGDPAVTDTITRAIARGDAYAAAWAQQRARSCQAANLDGALDADTHARIDACLDDDRAGLEVVVAELERADPRMLLRLGATLAGMRWPDRCADPDVLRRYPPTAATVTVEAASVRRSVARIAMLQFIGSVSEATTELRAVEARVATLEVPRLQALVHMAAADLAYHSDDVATAQARLISAHDSAGAAGIDEIAAEAAIFLGEVVGVYRADPTSGRAWLRLAEMWHTRLGVGPDDGRRISLLRVHARLAQAAGDLAGASMLFEQVLAATRRFYGPNHPDVGAILLDLGVVHTARGDLAGAQRRFEHALAIETAARGEHHPRVGDVLYNLATLRAAIGDPARASALFRRALEIYARAYGPDDPSVGDTWQQVGAAELARGDHVEARAAFERARAIAEQDPEARGELLALALAGLGEADLALHGPDRALVSLEQALALPGSLASDAAVRASAQFALARALAAVDPADPRAQEQARAARVSLEEVTPPPRARLAQIDHWLAGRR